MPDLEHETTTTPPSTMPATSPAAPSTPAAPPTAAPAPDAAAAPAAASASGGRWLLAFGMAGAVLAITAVAIILLGGRPTPEALRYIPGDVAVVAELRMDLPGDQFQKFGNLLAHFPGFKDQSTLPEKIDESLARLVTTVSSGAVDYAKQLQPWLAGPVFAGARADGSAGPARSMLVVATTDGKVSCDAVFRGATTATETYRGVAVQTAGDGSMACALDGRYGLLGSPAMVRAGLDAHADHTGVDGQAAYRAARDTVATDQLVSVYAGKDAFTNLGAVPSILAGGPQPSAGLESALARLPAWTMVALHAEDDAVVVDVVTAPLPAASPGAGSPLPTAPPAHVSRLAKILPGDTTAVVEIHGAGIAAANGLALLRADPNLSGPLGQVDGALSILGGADQLVGWIEDLGVVVVPDGSTITGGVVLLAADDATAAAKAEQLRGILTLAGLSGGFTTRDTVVNGTKVTIADLGDVSALLKASGTNLNVPPGTHLVLSLAAHGSAVIIGGETFAGRLLDTGSSGVLADQAGYKRALGRAAESNLGQLYLGGASALALAERAMPEADRTQFGSSVKPYLDPIDAVLTTISVENGNTRVRIVATVK